MLIKKNEEPFFHRFLSIAKEIIKKNSAYPPVFYGDDEKLYLVCNNYAAVYDFQSNLLLDDELREFGKIPYELSELPNGDMMLSKAEHFNCQESYLIAVRNFFKNAGYLSRKVFSVEKGDPKHNAYDQQEMEFVQQPAEYDSFENMDVEEPEETYREEQELDSLMDETIIEETRGVEDEFDPMRA